MPKLVDPNLTESKFSTQTFGDRLRELSDGRGTYSQIARDLGINRQQFARYLNGSSRPRDALIRKMALYFGVDEGLFFQNQPIEADPKDTAPANEATAMAMLQGIQALSHEVITEQELPSGFYMQYRQSFTRPGKIICILSRITRNRQGVVRCKRRYTARLLSQMPGVRGTHVSYAVFAKHLGTLIMMERNGIAGDLVFTSFKPSSIFSITDRVKTGVMMTHGRPSGLGPVAGRHVIDKIPDEGSKLEWARRQGFFDLSELPNFVQHHFQSPPHIPDEIMAVQ